MSNIVRVYGSVTAGNTPVPATLGTRRISAQNADGRLFITNAAATSLYRFDAVGPTFSATLSATQTISNNTYTRINCNTVGWDTNSNYSTTLYRFTPSVPGYYQINAFGILNSSGALIVGNANQMQIAVYRNGTLYRIGSGGTLTATSFQQVISRVNTLVQFNGASDYIDMYALINGNGTLSVTQAGLEGIFVRGL